VPKNLEHRVDIETGLDDDGLSQVRFGRNRFLRLLGVGLFGMATIGIADSTAEARPPKPRGLCNSDQGEVECPSCSKKWRRNHARSEGTCGSNDPPCWNEQHGEYQWKCCDWELKDGSHCYCPKYLGRA
jgi:hypothetical protein